MRTRLLVLVWGFIFASVNCAPQSEIPSTITASDDNAMRDSDNSKGSSSSSSSSSSNSNSNSNDSEGKLAGTEVVANVTVSQNEAANATQATDDKVIDENASGGDQSYEELPQGMSESLADFVLNILKEQLSNATKPAPETPPASEPNTTHPLPSSPADVPLTSTMSVQSDDGAAGGQAEEKEGETTVMPTDENYSSDSDDWSSTENFPTSITEEPFSKNGKANCQVTVDMNNYCIVDDFVIAYFKEDMTSVGLSRPLFDMDLVRRLMSCPRGEWCLGNELDLLQKMAKSFYDGPLCEESMWECIFKIMLQREDCDDKEFMFIVDAVGLMCELLKPPLEEENERMCFAHALAALHVTYADFLDTNMSTPLTDSDAYCEGYSFRMIQTYLCADGSCDDLFESRLAMEKFGRWSWFMDEVDDVVWHCDLKDTCGALEERTPTTTPVTTQMWFTMSTPSIWPFSHTDVLNRTDQVGHGEDDMLNDEDRFMMIALSVATGVGLLFMVLGLVFWRRNRRRSLYYYRTEGYGKVAADEAHLLSRSSAD